MGTRGAIAIPTTPGAFSGRYHHWDSYPSGLGRTLWQALHGHFKGNMAAMRQFLLQDHPSGFSTIVGADLTLSVGWRDHNDGLCMLCGRKTWEHYRQYYDGQNGKADVGRPLPDPALASADNPILVLGHQPKYDDSAPEPAQCYCHGARHEDAQEVTQDDASAIGCEYVYLLRDDALEILTARNADGSQMIGMFGSGNANAAWRTLAVLPWDGCDPNWDEIETRNAAKVA